MSEKSLKFSPKLLRKYFDEATVSHILSQQQYVFHGLLLYRCESLLSKPYYRSNGNIIFILLYRQHLSHISDVVEKDTDPVPGP